MIDQDLVILSDIIITTTITIVTIMVIATSHSANMTVPTERYPNITHKAAVEGTGTCARIPKYLI